ncbi:sensor histidine kinase [Jiangella alba]|uniref:Two-component system, NarL family, sensor histidine kinase DesK n=1 Tax=Jiangella alba TaxID=561176 RepID=A0A1H5PQI8_9ACTN|nr:histidine kinase [Jiangella alba]SEF15488.1 two-component system, NarL family, sensor histidine kinase DesK [Jiangella alba]
MTAPDARLRRARWVVLLFALVATVSTALTGGLIGIFGEDDARVAALGALGVALFCTTQAGAVYAVLTPWATETTRHRWLVAFLVAAAVSVPLAGPLDADDWQTWAWLGGPLAGSAPLLLGRVAGTALATGALGVSALVGWWTGASVPMYVGLTLINAVMVAALCGVPMWLWDLLVEAREGRLAQARLAATEERLRFARDVHDLLGHTLSVIALKTELAARLATTDGERAGREAEEARSLAASALTEMRQVVHGYRAVDLDGQLDAIRRVLESSGVRCTVTGPEQPLTEPVSTLLIPVLREASTNVLRHSRARWCTIDICRGGEEVRMTVVNDGATGDGPDAHSSGLRGLADRLAEAGGTLRSSRSGDVFTLVVAVRP